MASATQHDIEKGLAAVSPAEVAASTTDNSLDPKGKLNSLDREVSQEQKYDGTRHLTSSEGGKQGYWATRMEKMLGVEARGITRVLSHEKKASRPLHDYFQMFSLWFSINLQAVNLVIGLFGPLVFGLGWVDCVCIVIFANALASCGPAYLSTFGPESGNRTMVCFACVLYIIWLGYSLLQANFIRVPIDHRPIFHGLLAIENRCPLQHCTANRLRYHRLYYYWSDDHRC